MQADIRQKLKLTDNAAAKLAKLHLHTAWDLALHLPLRYEDETQVVPIAAAPIGESCQVEGVVLHQEVQFKPTQTAHRPNSRRIGFGAEFAFYPFYPNHQKQLAQGQTVRALGEIKRGYYGE